MTAPAMRRRAGPAQVADFAPESMIELRGVVKQFTNAAGVFTVLKGIDLTIERGEFVSIVGKSGSGKSTLLNMITGIDHPTEGQVVVNGTDIYTGVSESQRSNWRGKNLGIVFQFFQLLPMLTLLENVMLPMDYVDMYDFDERPERAMQLLKLVGLEKFANKLPVLVSTGQQQLAAIARAMACEPPLLIADEPTGNLDTRSADTIIQLFQHFVDLGTTIVMVTHDPSLTARTHRNIVISDGELVDEAVSKSLPQLRHRHMLEFGGPLVRSHAWFFGAAELMGDERPLAGLRAAANQVEVLAVPRDIFLRVMKESPITAEAIRLVPDKRAEAQRIAGRAEKNA